MTVKLKMRTTGSILGKNCLQAIRGIFFQFLVSIKDGPA